MEKEELLEEMSIGSVRWRTPRGVRKHHFPAARIPKAIRRKNPREFREVRGGNAEDRSGLDRWKKALESNHPRMANGKKAEVLAKEDSYRRGKTSKGSASRKVEPRFGRETR